MQDDPKFVADNKHLLLSFYRKVSFTVPYNLYATGIYADIWTLLNSTVIKKEFYDFFQDHHVL